MSSLVGRSGWSKGVGVRFVFCVVLSMLLRDEELISLRG